MPKKQTAFSELVGQRLRVLRIAIGFPTIRGFAQDLDVGEDRYDKWEKGKALIPPEIVGALKLKYGITADWLYFGEESSLTRQLYSDLKKSRLRLIGNRHINKEGGDYDNATEPE